MSSKGKANNKKKAVVAHERGSSCCVIDEAYFCSLLSHHGASASGDTNTSPATATADSSAKGNTPLTEDSIGALRMVHLLSQERAFDAQVQVIHLCKAGIRTLMTAAAVRASAGATSAPIPTAAREGKEGKEGKEKTAVVALNGALSAGIEVLVHTYLLPSLLSLRKYLEWIVDGIRGLHHSLLKHASTSQELNCLQVVRNACLRVLCLHEMGPSCAPALGSAHANAQALSDKKKKHTAAKATTSVAHLEEDGEHLLLWSHTFSAMAQLDKELRWLGHTDIAVSSSSSSSSSSGSAAGDEGDPLLRYLLSALHMVQVSADKLLVPPPPSPPSPPTAAAAAAVVKAEAATAAAAAVAAAADTGASAIAHRESACESMRSITTVIKSRRHLLWELELGDEVGAGAGRAGGQGEGATGTAASFVQAFTEVCLRLLSGVDVHKDVLTNASMGITCMQWLCCGPLEPLPDAAKVTLFPSQDDAHHIQMRYRETRATLQLLVLSLILPSHPVDEKNVDGSNFSTTYDAPALRALAVEAGFSAGFISSLVPLTATATADMAAVCTLTQVGRTSLLRGFLSVYPPASLRWCKYDSATSATAAVSSQVGDRLGGSGSGSGVVDHGLSAFGALSQSSQDTLLVALSALGDTQSVFFGPLLTLAMDSCNSSSDLLAQLYGMQTLDVWLGTIVISGTGANAAPVTAAADAQVSKATSSSVMSPTLQATLGHISPTSTHAHVMHTAALVGTRVAAEIKSLQTIGNILSAAWVHPNKKMSHLVPTLHSRLVDSLESFSFEHSFTTEQKTQMWAPLVAAALDMPAGHRARYQSLTTLLPRVGAGVMFSARSSIFSDLIESLELRDVCSSVCACIASMLKELIRAATAKATNTSSTNTIDSTADLSKPAELACTIVRDTWMLPVVRALCSSNLNRRQNSVNYLLPELLKIDPYCGIPIILQIRVLHAQLAPTATAGVAGDGDATEGRPLPEYCLWGLVSVCLHTRLLGVAGGDILDSAACNPATDIRDSVASEDTLSPVQLEQYYTADGSDTASLTGLTAQELELACISGDADLRMSALTALTISQQKGAPIPPADLAYLKRYLPHTLNSGDHDVKQRLLRIVKGLVNRLLESRRMAGTGKGKIGKAATKASRAARNASGSSSAVVVPDVAKTEEKIPEHLTLAHVSQTTMQTLEWLAEILLNNMYPGTGSDREVISLELLATVLDVCKGVVELSAVAKLASRTDTKADAGHKAGVTKATTCSSASAARSLIDDIKLLLTVEKAGVAAYCPFFSISMTNTIINLLSSNWDRTRRAAADVLLRFPRPLPGYGDVRTPAVGANTQMQPAAASTGVQTLVTFGLEQCGSPRQRESEAGALLLSTLFAVYCADLGYDMRAVDPADADSMLLAQAHAQQAAASSRQQAPIDEISDRLRANVITDMGRMLSDSNAGGTGGSGSGSSFSGMLSVGKVQTHLLERINILMTGNSSDASGAFLAQFSNEKTACSSLLFLLDLVDLVDKRVDALSVVFAEIGKAENEEGEGDAGNGEVKLTPEQAAEQEQAASFALCHGLLLAVRYCVLTCQQNGMLLVPKYQIWELQTSRNSPILSTQYDKSSPPQVPQVPQSPTGAATTTSQGPQSAVCIACWYYLMQRVLFISHKALNIAMSVVAEAKTDVPFAPTAVSSLLPSGGDSNSNKNQSGSGIKGPVIVQDAAATALPKEKTKMAATYTNANSMSGAISSGNLGGEDGEGEEVEKGSLIQRAVIAAWMLVKESSAMLALLVELSPADRATPHAVTLSALSAVNARSAGNTASVVAAVTNGEGSGAFTDSDGKTHIRPPPRGKNAIAAREAARPSALVPMPLLSSSEIATIGDVTLDALGRLKHMGAIAEVHAAFQAMCTHLLRCATVSSVVATSAPSGSASTPKGPTDVTVGPTVGDLSSLPMQWLKAVLARLGSKKQVFVLRRSAGFAYTFLSLLRAEPLNVTATLMPVALNQLLMYAENGMLGDKYDTYMTAEAEDCNKETEKILQGEAEAEKKKTDARVLRALGRPLDVIGFATATGGDEWPTTVHAMNALRLIIVDSCLAGDIDAYVERSLKLAVTGFVHSQWGVRNSSMMMFAAIMQRAVDNDKRSEAGARGSTARGFFRRFPGLLTFLLKELALALEGGAKRADGKPAFTALQGGVTPSLYPILLLLAKMKPEEAEAGGANAEKENGSTTAFAAEETSVRAPTPLATSDVHQFLPLLYRCAALPEQKVRNAASAAVAALIPLNHALPTACQYLQNLCNDQKNSSTSANQSVVSPMSANETHGRLLQVLALLRGVGMRKSQTSSGLELQQQHALLQVLWDLLGKLSMPHKSKSRPYSCPPVVRIFLHIVRCFGTSIVARPTSAAEMEPASSAITLHRIYRVMQDLWNATCRWALWPVCPTDKGFEEQYTEARRVPHTLPYEPLLWQEAVADMMYLQAQMLSKADTVAPASPFQPLSLPTLVSLLGHPLSEVRSGVLEGCVSVMTSASSSNSIHTLGAYGREEMILWISHLLPRLRRETEPPLLTLVLQCLCMLLPMYIAGDRNKSISMRQVSPTQAESRLDTLLMHTTTWDHLLLICLTPDSLQIISKQVIASTTANSAGNSAGANSDTAHAAAHVFLPHATSKFLWERATELGWAAGAAAVNLLKSPLGGGACAGASSSTSNDGAGPGRSASGSAAQRDPAQPNLVLRSGAGVAGAIEILGGILGRLTQSSSDASMDYFRVQQWLALAEAGANEEQSTDVRASVAKSMLSAGISELWSAAAAPTPTEAITVGYIRVRVWLLALVLLQDDDDDVRRTAGKFVHRASATAKEEPADSTASADAGSTTAAQPILPPLLAVEDINLSATGRELGRALVHLISAADTILNHGNVATRQNAGACLDIVRTSIESILYTIDAAVGSRQSVRDVIAASEQSASTSRVFEAEQANLHMESRATAAVLLSSLVYAVRTCQQASTSMPDKHSRIPMHVQAWLLTRAWTAVDFINASTSVQFTSSSGGATYDKRVFIWCETALHAVADLWQETACVGKGLSSSDSGSNALTSGSPGSAADNADTNADDTAQYAALQDIGEALGQSPTVRDLRKAVELVQERASRASGSREEVHPLLLVQLKRLRPMQAGGVSDANTSNPSTPIPVGGGGGGDGGGASAGAGKPSPAIVPIPAPAFVVAAAATAAITAAAPPVPAPAVALTLKSGFASPIPGEPVDEEGIPLSLLPTMAGCDPYGPEATKLQDKFPDVPLCTVVRFLIARKGNVQKAAEMLSNHLVWRKQNLPLTEANSAGVIKALETGAFFPYGIAKDGTPVLVFRGGMYNSAVAQPEDYTMAFAWGIEEALRNTAQLQVTVLINARSAEGGTNAPAEMAFIKKLTGVLSDNFPERLKRTVLFPMPWYARLMKSAAALFMDARSMEKIIFAGHDADDRCPEMLQYISEEQITSVLGGTNPKPIPNVAAELKASFASNM